MPDLEALERRALSARCVRSGFCCKVATCAIGVRHGAELRGCRFLLGDTPGRYRCGLVEERPELAEAMAIGAGCSSTMFNADRADRVRER